MIVFDLPLKVPFRGITRRQGVLFEGPAGWAEWSPFVEYGDDEAARWLRAAWEVATTGHPEPLRDHIEVNGIVPALAPEAAAERAVASGCTTVKVKVGSPGQHLADDVARVRAVREALPAARLRVDANGAWGVEEAVAAARALAPFDLEYIEQPCPEVHQLAELRRRLAGLAAVAADESIRRAGDPRLVRDLQAADIVVLKLQPLGGARACLSLARELGLPVVVSSAVESAVGLYACLRLAAAIPGLDRACGLETGRLLVDDVAPLPIEGGAIRVGAPPLPTAVPRADTATTRWWLSRLERAARIAGVGL